jgi:transcriptional regulator with GAF, ATPase, and Fis domain
LIEDALSDEKLGSEESIRGLTLRSIMAIPLRMEDYLAGAIHLENEATKGAFDEPDLKLLLDVGRLVAIYLDSAFRVNEEIAARQRIYSELKGRTRFDGVVGSSPKLLKVLETVEQVAPTEATVIIEGENGTGKELIARALHRSSNRSHRDLVVVNCAAIPDTLLESQLFGHERGSFTGAVSRQIGRLEQANGSTVFLDEIGELSIGVQAKLLRFLQNREIERLGGTKTIKLDVRLVAATNRDINEMVQRGDFREDLYYRLYVIPIRVPSLRERPEDIPLLADHFIDIYSLQSGRKRPVIDPDVFEALQGHKWPGNIRELENLIQRVVVLTKSDRITLGDLPPNIAQAKKVKLDIDKNPFGPYFSSLPTNWAELKRRRKQMLHIASVYAKNLEDKFLDDLLARTGGNISRAATESGMHRTLIHRKLKAREE